MYVYTVGKLLGVSSFDIDKGESTNITSEPSTNVIEKQNIPTLNNTTETMKYDILNDVICNKYMAHRPHSSI